MIVTYQGQEFGFDQDKITVDEWRELKRKYHMTPKGFESGIGEADPDASTFLYWVMLRQNGHQAAVLGDTLKPDIIALNAALAAAQDPAGDTTSGEEADPTRLPVSPQLSASPPDPQSPAPGQEEGAPITGS